MRAERQKASEAVSSTLPHILQEHFQRAGAVLKCADEASSVAIHLAIFLNSYPACIPSLVFLENGLLEENKGGVKLKSRAGAQMSLGFNTWVLCRHF